MKERCEIIDTKPWIVRIFYAPKNGGRRSISTFSVTTNRLLLCLRGGLPTIGMVSLGPVLRRLNVPTRGGVAPPPRPPWSMLLETLSGEPPRWSPWSGLTTTIGGVPGTSLLYLRSGVPGPEEAGDEARLVKLLLATVDEPGCGRGFAVFGGGGGAIAAEAGAGFASLFFEDEFPLLSCGRAPV